VIVIPSRSATAAAAAAAGEVVAQPSWYKLVNSLCCRLGATSCDMHISVKLAPIVWLAARLFASTGCGCFNLEKSTD